METPGSVTVLLQQMTDQLAAQTLYERYIQQLVTVANRKLGRVPRAFADGEDVAQSVFQQFFAGFQRFPKLNDRRDLWQILLMLTARRCRDQQRRYLSEIRGGGRVLGESALESPAADSSTAPGLHQVPGPEPTPEDADAAVHQLELLLGQLPNESLRRIAILKMQGYTTTEIAEKVQRCSRTIERAVDAIRQTWLGDP